MISVVFKALIPDAIAAIQLVAFALCGIAIGWALRKFFLFASKILLKPTGTAAIPTRKIIAGTILEALARTGIFLFTGISFIAFAIYSGNTANLPPEATKALSRLFWIFVSCSLAVFTWNLVRLPLALIRRYASPSSKSAATLLPLFSALMKIGILGIGILIIIRIATDTQPAEIIAMLGIGGLAVGLASQDTVKNFFGSLMLILDRPFQVGDMIDIGAELAGTVEEVGVRSTRIRSRDGSVLSIPNGDLANRIIRTVTARETIRDEINLGLIYSTQPEQIENAVVIIRQLLNDPLCVQNGTNAPRVYFSRFQDASLNITAVYHFASSDYAEFLRFKHNLNLAILRQFNETGLEFAFPTQTVYVKR